MGSMQKRGKDSYFLTVSSGFGLGGKRRRYTKTIHARNDTEAKRILTQFQADVDSGNYLKTDKLIFERFAIDWMEKYGKVNLSAKTLQHYKEMLLTRIIPAFGKLVLEKIKPVHILEFYENLKENGIRLDTTYILKPEAKKIIEAKKISHEKLAELTKISSWTISNALKGLPIKPMSVKKICKGLELELTSSFKAHGEPNRLSDETIRHHHRLLSIIFETAVRWQILKDNPVKRISPPRAKKKDIYFYDLEQIKTLIDKLNTAPDNYKAAIILTIFTGMRRSELMGLRWQDIDFDNNTINIQQISQYVSGTGNIIKETKNTTSRRKISTPAFVFDLLNVYKLIQKELRIAFDDDWINSGMVFVGDNGEPMHPETVSKWFVRFIKNSGLPPITFHGLRHSHATMLLANNADIAYVAKRLGHSTNTTTMNIYAHAIESVDRIMVERLEKMFPKEDPNTEKKSGNF